jgi:hypothetical protein
MSAAQLDLLEGEVQIRVLNESTTGWTDGENGTNTAVSQHCREATAGLRTGHSTV